MARACGGRQGSSDVEAFAKSSACLQHTFAMRPSLRPLCHWTPSAFSRGLTRWLRLAVLSLFGLFGAANLASSAGSSATARWGGLLISFPDSEFPQIVNLDSLEGLARHPDRNAKGARFFGDSRHYYKIQNVGFKQDSFAVYDAASGQLEYQARSVPRISEAEPSPHAASVFSFVFLDVASDKGLFAIVDLANEPGLLASYKGDVGKYLHWWMPDGSIRRLHAHTGELSAWRGKPQERNERMDWQVIGEIPPPLPGVIFGMAALSPKGNELVLSTVDVRTRKVDLWMADFRDPALRRITSDGFVSFVTWSPDGRHMLFQRNNVSSIDTSFTGQCSYWIAPSSARELTGIVPGTPHAVARQVFYGSRQAPSSPPCGKVAAWVK